MAKTVIEGVTLVPGGRRDMIGDASVVLDDGVVVEIAGGVEGADEASDVLLVPAAVDVHLDNLVERRRPRATVSLDHAAVLSVLDAECAAAGIATVCVAARCEDSPRKGIAIADAAVLAATVEQLAPVLCCDWRIHARVELTDEQSLDSLRAVLAASSRVALISMIETSVQRSRFSSLAETRSFYAQDWGVTEDEVENIFTVDDERRDAVAGRRREVAALAFAHDIVLASHDDRTAEHIQQGFDLGARVAEFPLTIEAARRADQLGMHVVLGAPNAVRGRSTSSGNVLAADAVAAGVCDVLCSDYLPSSLHCAPWALASAGASRLSHAVDLVSVNPATVLGLRDVGIAVGRPLTASLRRVQPPAHRRADTAQVGTALWREGRLVFSREANGCGVAFR